ncbi:DUF3500 domain-containing protein [Tropicimonas aquimaris]|uniref:DUF3500 domain-containing protein n=1 Tax=Tropicimonas aquimaris TaxID=914152 RepID=A0ABW3IVR2_9RHOB
MADPPPLETLLNIPARIIRSTALVLILTALAAHAQSGPPPGGDGARLSAEQVAEDPFVGITTDGTVVPDLYPLTVTGLSTDAMRDAASAFIASLTDEQRDAALYDVDALEWRLWSNVDDYDREGVSLDEMTDAQKSAAFAMLDAVLSDQGMTEVRDAMQLNRTLGELTGELDRFNENLYWFTMMGTPDAETPWGFQIDGHHIAINFLVVGDQLSITPAFLGAEPTIAPEGTSDAGLSILQTKQDLGLAFTQSLDEAQLDQAVISPDKVTDDMIAAAFSDNVKIPYAGLNAAEMTGEQREDLMGVIAAYANDMEEGHAEVWLDHIATHLDETWFAWIGGTEDDAVFYYRIQSPVVLIEFDHQTHKPLANVEGYPRDVPVRTHAHSIVRTPNGNDYGKDWLAEHLATHH